MTREMQAKALREGSVPQDYPFSVAEDWPDLIGIVRRMVKPERDVQKRDAIRNRWWQYADKRPGLYNSTSGLSHVLAVGAAATTHHAIARLPANLVFSHKLIIICLQSFAEFSMLQARTHELWCTTFGSTRGAADDSTYNPSDVFINFPFPNIEADTTLDAAGQAYHDHRAQLMVARDEGLTKTYNRFHDRDENSADILELRRLHTAMDHAVLRAYGWDDLIPQAVPQFLDETNEDDHKYQGRYFWPADVRDEILARLLNLNAERAAEEKALGIAQPGTTSQEEDALEDME